MEEYDITKTDLNFFQFVDLWILICLIFGLVFLFLMYEYLWNHWDWFHNWMP